MKDNQFTPEDFSNPLTAEVKKSIKQSQSKFFSRRLLLLILTPTTLILICILILFPFFSVRSIASNLMDTLGNHEAALVLDVMSKKNLSSAFGVVNANLNNKDKCQIPINNSILNQNLSNVGLSGKSYVNVYPTKTGDEKGLFNLKMYFEGFSRLEDGVSYLTNQTKLSIDGSKINANEQILPIGNNKINLDQSLKAFVKQDDGIYLQPSSLKISSSQSGKNISENGVSTNFQNSNWYKYDNQYNEKQKNAVNENNRLISSIALTPPNALLSSQTQNAISKTICDSVDKYKVNSYSDIAFGPNSESYKLRPIEITIKDNLPELLPSNLQAIAENVTSDEVLKNYLKGNYNNIVKYYKNSDTISNVTYYGQNVPSEEEFKKSIDNSFSEANQSVKKDKIPQDFLRTFDTNIKQSFIVYLDQYTLNPSAIYTKTVLSSKNGETLKSLPQSIKDELSEGVTIETQIYDIRTNSNIATTPVPQTNLTFNDLYSQAFDNPQFASFANLLDNTSFPTPPGL